MPVIKGWKFPVQIDKSSGKIQTVEDNECVKQGLNTAWQILPGLYSLLLLRNSLFF